MSELNSNTPEVLTTEKRITLGAEIASQMGGTFLRNKLLDDSLTTAEQDLLRPSVNKLKITAQDVNAEITDASARKFWNDLSASKAAPEAAKLTNEQAFVTSIKDAETNRTIYKMANLQDSISNRSWIRNTDAITGQALDYTKVIATSHPAPQLPDRLWKHNAAALQVERDVDAIYQARGRFEQGTLGAGFAGILANAASEVTIWKDTPMSMRTMAVAPLLELGVMAIPRVGMVTRALGVFGAHQTMRAIDAIENTDH